MTLDAVHRAVNTEAGVIQVRANSRLRAAVRPVDTSAMTSKGLIEVAATPHDVFEAICEFADPPPFSRILPPRGPLGSGAIYEVRSRAFGRRFTHVFAVHQWMPPTGVEFRSLGRPQFAFSAAYIVTATEGPTRVEFVLTVTPRGMWRATSPLVRRRLDRITRDALERLRSRSEAVPTNRVRALEG
jgi:hypothetical protein